MKLDYVVEWRHVIIVHCMLRCVMLKGEEFMKLDYTQHWVFVHDEVLHPNQAYGLLLQGSKESMQFHTLKLLFAVRTHMKFS